jgi:hypothetical protein
MSTDSSQTIPRKIQTDILLHSQEFVAKEFANQILHESFRIRITALFNENIETVAFMEKVKKYASQEIETKLYRSIGFWIKTVIIPIGVSVLTMIVFRYVRLD